MIEGQHRQRSRNRQLREQMLLCQQQANAAVLDHVAEAVLRVFRVQRHIGAAGLEHGEQADDHLQATLGGDTHQCIGADAQFHQLVGELVGALVELVIAQLLVAEHQRRGIGCGRHLGFDQLLDAVVQRVVGGGGVPCADHLMLLGVVEHRQFGQSPLRPVNEALQQAQPVLSQALNRRRAEQCRAVLDTRRDLLWRVVHVHRQVELGLMLRHRQERQAQLTQRQSGRLILAHPPVEQGLEQRVGLSAALQLQALDDQFNRVVGMFHRRPRLLAQRLEKLACGQVVGELRAIDLAADEEPHQVLGLALITAGIRHANGEILLAAVATEQQLPGAQQHDKRRQVLLLAEAVQLLAQGCGH